MGMGRLNSRGNWVEDNFFFYRDRYYYDLHICNTLDWVKLDIEALYFGVWYNETAKVIITFVEGDESRTFCIDDKKFALEKEAQLDFYRKAV